MNGFLNKTAQWIFLFAIVMLNIGLFAQEADNEFTIDAKINTRGEIRVGGFDLQDEDENSRKAQFIMGQYRINLGYKRADWFEVKLSPQFSGIWGQAGGTLSLAEGWFSMRHNKTGLFAKIGRQVLEYDDERILGYDDWTMTAPTHDVLKFGFEGYGHKVHALLAYNQNSDNVSAGTSYYAGGIQPYKTMQTLWYHYTTPKSIFEISLLGMNVGMQSLKSEKPDKTFYQQLFGTYMVLKPSIVRMEGAFYYQMGKEEHGIPLNAYMGSAKLKVTPNDFYNLFVGYDYLSGDKYFAVPTGHNIGMVHHDVIKGLLILVHQRALTSYAVGEEGSHLHLPGNGAALLQPARDMPAAVRADLKIAAVPRVDVEPAERENALAVCRARLAGEPAVRPRDNPFKESLLAFLQERSPPAAGCGRHA